MVSALPQVIQDFSKLGKEIAAWLHDEKKCAALTAAMQQSIESNTWFTEQTIRQSLAAIATEFLDERKLQAWVTRYTTVDVPKRVGVVMAGNIPLVGFHDFLCVLASGNYFVGKLSHKDKFLLPALVEMLRAINPEWCSRTTFVDAITDAKIDALIATGSDATASFFKKKFGALPHLIRHNRRSAAILDGSETKEELHALAVDIFSYFGMGCRNVSMLYVPQNYNWCALQEVLAAHSECMQHVGYAHNYRYQKAILTLQGQPFMDAGTVLLHESDSLHAPPAVVHYSYYTTLSEVPERLAAQGEQLQCVVARATGSKKFCTFGTAQQPQLDDYADGIDTMQWLAAR